MRKRPNPDYDKLHMYVDEFLNGLVREMRENVGPLVECVDELKFWQHAKKTANNDPQFIRLCDRWSLTDTSLEAIKSDIRKAVSESYGCDESPDGVMDEMFRAYKAQRLDQDLLAHGYLAVADRATIMERYHFPDSVEWAELRITVLSAAMYWAGGQFNKSAA